MRKCSPAAVASLALLPSFPSLIFPSRIFLSSTPGISICPSVRRQGRGRQEKPQVLVTQVTGAPFGKGGAVGAENRDGGEEEVSGPALPEVPLPASHGRGQSSGK